MKALFIIFATVSTILVVACDNGTTRLPVDEAAANDADTVTDQSDLSDDSDLSDETVTDDDTTAEPPCKIPDTGQDYCFSLAPAIACPAPGDAFYGQDAQYLSCQPAYLDNGDGTVTDTVTGLMWTRAFTKTSWADAFTVAEGLTTGGHNDWRVPTIKELYSLMNFSGGTGSGSQSGLAVPHNAVPFIDTDFFDFEYGTVNRFIDVQYVTSTQYVGTVMDGQDAFFGLNLADGRIKGYPLVRVGVDYYARFVRGRTDYGTNDLVDNGDETVTDRMTGLMWMKYDNGHYGVGDTQYGGLLWEAALDYCEGSTLAGYDDWRLPNAKELQYLVDYTRSPTTTGTPAIDPIFDTTAITVEDGSSNFPFYWTATTHVEGDGMKAAYLAFGQAFGFMTMGSTTTFMDVHGAGCQRSDPKTGDPADYPTGFGPQGDVIRIYNFVRCVRGGATYTTATADPAGFEQEMADRWDEGQSDTDTVTTPDSDIPVGPTTCEGDDDCAVTGACPPGALMGCGCRETPSGDKVCMPLCENSDDCPVDMNGNTMTCDNGVCRPA